MMIHLSMTALPHYKYFNHTTATDYSSSHSSLHSVILHTCTLKGHTNTVSSVAVSLDGRTVASGSEDKTVK